MSPALPDPFLSLPLAHRALHDVSAGRPENSRAAIEAAVAAGYGIEIDVQESADGRAMVFHDYDLDRLTGERGRLKARDAAALGRVRLTGGDEGVPRLEDVLEIVAGRVPLLVEIKDQDGALGPGVGGLEQAVADILNAYRGPVAVMSFNPHSVSALQSLAPDLPRGLTTEDFEATTDWPVDAGRRRELSGIPDYARVGACFISHNHRHLDMGRVAELKEAGARVLSWTIRSPEDEARARRIADNVTFEGYLPATSA